MQSTNTDAPIEKKHERAYFPATVPATQATGSTRDWSLPDDRAVIKTADTHPKSEAQESCAPPSDVGQRMEEAEEEKKIANIAPTSTRDAVAGSVPPPAQSNASGAHPYAALPSTAANVGGTNGQVGGIRSNKFGLNGMEVLSKAAEAKLEVVPRATSEYMQVMMHLGDKDVDSVRKLRNEQVDVAFTVAVSGVAGNYELMKVLHGTNVASIDAIVREGFKVGGEEVAVRNGNVSGKGVYLTTEVNTAAAYSSKHKCKYMLLCELCVDWRYIKTFNSVFVQPDKSLVRPLYVVEFKSAKKI